MTLATLRSLTKKQVEILKYIATGNSNKQIALSMDTSEQTVKNQITGIMLKLNANNRTHAVVTALKLGYITLEELTED